MMAGVLVVDKPQGLTSHDVVAAARRALGERRIGHCGTLDPMATGVLVLAIGPATRLVQFLSGEAKRYDAVVAFGRDTTTWDATGDLVRESPLRPAADALARALATFRGTFDQRPPGFSAKKVAGVRAYEIARREGTAALVLPAVPVTCHRLELTAFDGERAWLSMEVSAGFYVRSLAHDLGAALGTGAVLESLRRTSSGSFAGVDAVAFDALVQGGFEGVRSRLRPLDDLLPDVPAVRLSSDEARRVRHGRDTPSPTEWQACPPLARLLDEDGRLVALAVPAAQPGLLHPSVVLG